MTRLLPLVAIAASLALSTMAGPVAASGDEASPQLTVTRSARGPSLTEAVQTHLNMSGDRPSDRRSADRATIVSSVPAHGSAIFAELRAAED